MQCTRQLRFITQGRSAGVISAQHLSATYGPRSTLFLAIKRWQRRSTLDDLFDLLKQVDGLSIDPLKIVCSLNQHAEVDSYILPLRRSHYDAFENVYTCTGNPSILYKPVFSAEHRAAGALSSLLRGPGLVVAGPFSPEREKEELADALEGHRIAINKDGSRFKLLPEFAPGVVGHFVVVRMPSYDEAARLIAERDGVVKAARGLASGGALDTVRIMHSPLSWTSAVAS
jgi:hypothetical protein